MLEAELQRIVEEIATRYGWRFYHTHDSRRSVSGFPDLVLVKGLRILYVELKKDGGYPSKTQREWLADLHAAGQEVAVWWPKDLAMIVRCLGPRGERLTLLDRYKIRHK